MRKHYRNLLDITEVATGENKRDESSFSDADISFEKSRRDRKEFKSTFKLYKYN